MVVIKGLLDPKAKAAVCIPAFPLKERPVGLAFAAAQDEPSYSSVVPDSGGVNPTAKAAVVVPPPYLPQPALFKFGAAVQELPFHDSVEFVVAGPGALQPHNSDAEALPP